MNKIYLIIIILAVGAASFYGGFLYSQKKNSFPVWNNGDRASDFNAMRQGMAGQDGQAARGNRIIAREGMDFSNGEIIAKDDKSITVKVNDGGSKIIFLSGQTQIGKFETGTSQDLQIGQQITANGTKNEDGSITAQMIQIRPEANRSEQPSQPQ